jgi:hypothetical protein
MERPSPEHDPPYSELTRGERAQLFGMLGRFLVLKGTDTIAEGMTAPPDVPETREFHVSVPDDIIKQLFFFEDDDVEISPDSADFCYVTPHSEDSEGNYPLESQISLTLRGQLRGTDVATTRAYMLVQYDAPRRQTILAEVDCDYHRAGQSIEEEVVLGEDGVTSVVSESRAMTRQEADRLRQLVELLS